MNNRSDNFNPNKASDSFMAGVVGAAAGIAVGTAATIFLSKKDNREKIMSKLDEVKHKTQDSFNELSSKALDKKDEIQSQASQKLQKNGSIKV